MARKSKYDVEEKTTVNDLLSSGLGIFESLSEELEELCNNLEERFSSTSRYETLSTAKDYLSSAYEQLEVDAFADVPVTFTWRNKRRPSRAYQRDEGVARVQAAMEALERLKLSLEDENTTGAHDDEISSLDQWITDLETKISDAESAEFPGMFG